MCGAQETFRVRVNVKKIYELFIGASTTISNTSSCTNHAGQERMAVNQRVSVKRGSYTVESSVYYSEHYLFTYLIIFVFLLKTL